MSDALLIVGHGSRSELADDVLPYYVELFQADFEEVRACYLEQEPHIEDALSLIKAHRVFVMPLLMAHGYHTRVTIPRALGIESTHGHSRGKEIFLLEPLGRSEQIAKIIRERIGEANK
ncbi:sirohydrochlorin cobaltochelatase [Methanocella paludicola SANAE]|uniref:Sirohydrochlorin cobaltochelatase n=1 Tax=Methanocella paludicola (strain DSM 17711 / JCM 13418 / NBRC 101707 / SANAE) TaxID=304371 RepID=D1Z1M8_METPS|nr:CbiX/SirB N-terminal domain-containing protein [Methanocella paludicola]BAI62600.1 sirohydrochlorin cobaltochelatase [Methanocella paludicola SANAE]